MSQRKNRSRPLTMMLHSGVASLYLFIATAFFGSMLYAQSISVPGEGLYQNNSGSKGELPTQLAACSASMPAPKLVEQTTITYSNPRVGTCHSTGQCDCIYNVEHEMGGTIIYSDPDLVEQYWAERHTVCPEGMGETGAGFPATCQGSPQKEKGPSCPSEGNPIDPLTGNKFQHEQDFVPAKGLAVNRYYNSRSTINIGFGLGWSSNLLGKRLLVGATDVLVINATGYAEPWSKASGSWVGDPDSTIQVEDLPSGFQVTMSDDSTETYDLNGRLLTITDKSGLTQTYTYDAVSGELTGITNTYGQTFQITVDELSHITEIQLPDNEKIKYEYERGRLVKVIYPDDTPADDADNPTRIYQYEDHPSLYAVLTGITDEKGNNFATWTYDPQGRATSSQHANGVELVTLDYTYLEDPSDPRVTVTNELGKETTYHYTTLHGVRKVMQVEGHASANCVAANQDYTYDTNGFLDTVTDWENNVTDYDHDARGLEVQRIEAKGTSQERSITTQWHTDYRLPTKITEPDRVIDFSYDASGQLLERKETPVTP